MPLFPGGKQGLNWGPKAAPDMEDFYRYKPDPPKPRKNYKTEDGVIIEPVNFLTMPMKKGRV